MAEENGAIEANVAAVGESGDGVAGAGFGVGVGEWLRAIAVPREIEGVNAQALRGEPLVKPDHDVAIRGKSVQHDGGAAGRFDVGLHHGDGRVAGVDLVFKHARLRAKYAGGAGGDQSDAHERQKRVTPHAVKTA